MRRPRLQRDPLSIPAPVAIALADFCRRADRPSSPDEVRQALARLSSLDDSRVMSLCSEEPPTRPLSPHAVVDVLEGLEAEEAAAREARGHYRSMAEGIARDAAAAKAASEAAAAEARPTAAIASAPTIEAAPKARTRRASAKAPTPLLRRSREEVETRRLAREAETIAREDQEERPPPPRPGRKPAAPLFGRFVVGPAAKRPLRELGTDELAALISELRANTRGLTDRLDSLFSGEGGKSIDVRKLVRQHGLAEHFKQEERDNLRGLLRQQRGFEPPIRRALGLTGGELRRLIANHGLEAEARELKERTREEARADAPLASRLQLACSRTDALRDAGVLDELDQRNFAELEASLDRIASEREVDPVVLVELSRRELGIEPRPWRKAAEHYRLVHAAARRLGVPPPPEPGPEERPPRPPMGGRPPKRGGRPFERSGGSPERGGRSFERSGGSPERGERSFERSGGPPERGGRSFERSGGSPERSGHPGSGPKAPGRPPRPSGIGFKPRGR